MNVTHFAGLDPGIVHTGAVKLLFDSVAREIKVYHRAFAGCPANDIFEWVYDPPENPFPQVFIEKYRPKQSFKENEKMLEAMGDLRKCFKLAKVLDNGGVKKVVPKRLLELVGCWDFATPTHHQDLRSAARILLLGMMKDDESNQLLAWVVLDHLTGKTWTVVHVPTS